MPTQVEINGRIVEFENEPTPEDIDFAVSQLPSLEQPIKEQGILERIAAGILKTPARLATNVAQAGQGLFTGKQTVQPFSGDFLGEVKPIGMEGTFGQKLKESVGAGLELGSYAVGGGAGAGVVKTGLSGLAKQATIQGAKTGAVGGGLYGLGSSLQNPKTGLGGTLFNTATGAVLGGATGGILGGALGGIKGRAMRKATQEDDFVLDLVAPKATEAIKTQALREGRVTEQGLLSAGKITPSKRDMQLSEAVKGVVSSKNSPIQNIDVLGAKVQDINTGVKTYVSVNKVPFKTNQLLSQLNRGKDELNVIFASDKSAEKTYDAVVREFIKHVKDKDTAGLLDARQAVDKIPSIKKLLDSQGLGENVKREVVLTVRGMANKYIANLLPKGNKYRETLLRESHMIEALENIAEKNTGIIGANKLQALTKKYPVLKGVIGTVGVYLGLRAVGVGSSLIGSSD